MSSQSARTDQLIGTLLNDRYRIGRVIDRRGSGIIYETDDMEQGRTVHVKVLGPKWATDPVAVARFQREAQSAAEVAHRNIVEIYATGVLDDGRPWVAMERLEGDDLADIVADSRGVEPIRVAAVISQAAAALDAVHAKDIVHRDVKPDCFFLARTADGKRVLKLLDFGLAAIRGGGAAERLTRHGVIPTEPQYTAPEATGTTLPDHRADIYSLGIIAFRMLTGRFPFDDENPVRVLTMKLSGAAPTLTEASGQAFPEALEQAVASALAREPAGRQHSAGEFARALLAAARGERAAAAEARSNATDANLESAAAPEPEPQLAAPEPEPAQPATPSPEPRPAPARQPDHPVDERPSGFRAKVSALLKPPSSSRPPESAPSPAESRPVRAPRRGGAWSGGTPSSPTAQPKPKTSPQFSKTAPTLPGDSETPSTSGPDAPGSAAAPSHRKPGAPASAFGVPAPPAPPPVAVPLAETPSVPKHIAPPPDDLPPVLQPPAGEPSRAPSPSSPPTPLAQFEAPPSQPPPPEPLLQFESSGESEDVDVAIDFSDDEPTPAEAVAEPEVDVAPARLDPEPEPPDNTYQPPSLVADAGLAPSPSPGTPPGARALGAPPAAASTPTATPANQALKVWLAVIFGVVLLLGIIGGLAVLAALTAPVDPPPQLPIEAQPAARP